MARRFVRLKLALLAGGLRASRHQRLGFVLAVLFALPVAAWGFIGLSLAGSSEHGESILVVVFVALFAGWLVLPLLAFASDETLDPARLTLLPLTRRQLVTGLFAASVVGVGPATTLVALAGVVYGFAPAGPGALLVVVAVLLYVALCLVGSRALATALSGILRSRRGRDFLVALSVVLGVSLAVAWNAAVHLLDEVEPERLASALASVAEWLGWLPPGLAARAVADARAGELGAAAAELGLALAALAVLAWIWGAALGRALTTAPSAGRRSEGARRRSKTDLFPRLVAFLPRDRRGAVAAKDLRYWVRDPRLRAAWLATVLFGVAVVALVAFARSERRPEMVLAPVVLLWLTSFQALNQFGGDGSAAWTNVAATGRPRDDLLGKNLALAAVMLPFVVVLATVLAALTGGWVYLPATAVLAVALLGAVLAVGNVVSVRFPLPVHRSATNVWAVDGPGRAVFSALVQLVALAVLGLLVFPVVVAAVVGALLGPAWLTLAVVLAAAYGVGLWRVGFLVADERLVTGQPELLAALSADRR